MFLVGIGTGLRMNGRRFQGAVVMTCFVATSIEARHGACKPGAPNHGGGRLQRALGVELASLSIFFQ